VTDCADCHYASNLDDAPFNAPGGGSHTVPVCADGGCHGTGTSTMVNTVHIIDPENWGIKPSITVPTLNAPTVAQGTDVIVNATVTAGGARDYVDGAQYRIMSGTTVILNWTQMSASDGNFNGISDVATANINTNSLAGTYTIEVRGMAGGPATNASIRYYPINGDLSATNSTTLTVLPPMGYINGTVTSGGSEIQGVYVYESTTGANDTTKSDGTYSLRVPEGNYIVNASRQPTHYDTSVSNIVVTQSNTTIANISISQKPTGNISGTVRNA